MYQENYYPATDQESIQEWSNNYGCLYPERPWILNDRDIWVKNPYYKGENVPHPEEEEDIY